MHQLLIMLIIVIHRKKGCPTTSEDRKEVAGYYSHNFSASRHCDSGAYHLLSLFYHCRPQGRAATHLLHPFSCSGLSLKRHCMQGCCGPCPKSPCTTSVACQCASWLGSNPRISHEHMQTTEVSTQKKHSCIVYHCNTQNSDNERNDNWKFGLERIVKEVQKRLQ